MAKKRVNKKQKKDTDVSCCKNWNYKDKGGGIYCLGFIGSAIYYLVHATSFWNGVLGILKAIVWPVFIVMKILGL